MVIVVVAVNAHRDFVDRRLVCMNASALGSGYRLGDRAESPLVISSDSGVVGCIVHFVFVLTCAFAFRAIGFDLVAGLWRQRVGRVVSLPKAPRWWIMRRFWGLLGDRPWPINTPAIPGTRAAGALEGSACRDRFCAAHHLSSPALLRQPTSNTAERWRRCRHTLPASSPGNRIHTTGANRS